MLKTPIITLTSDFGLKDPFAGLMKGAILGINPDAKVVDVTHNIQRHNIFEASQVISMMYTYFPPTTIHIAVVDPGVGSTRRPILVVTEDHYFIGPDNGIFTPLFDDLQSHFLKVFHLTASHYFLPMSGSTFHGRDIFAPIAAWLSKGVDSHKMGEEISDYVKIPCPRPEVKDNTLCGEIVSIDSFGNAISNIKREHLSALVPEDSFNSLIVACNNEQLQFVHYYSGNESGRPAAIINSFGHVELFVYKASAAQVCNIKIGDQITVRSA